MTTQTHTVASLHDEFRALDPKSTNTRELATAIDHGRGDGDPEAVWRGITRDILTPNIDFAIHLRAHELVFTGWDASIRPAPVWSPDPEEIASTNLGALMAARGARNYDELFRWSVEHRSEFWQEMLRRVSIVFVRAPQAIVADERNVKTPEWLPGASLNIAESCFAGDPTQAAIVYASSRGEIQRMTLGELQKLTSRVVNSLRALGLEPGDAVAIDMLMTAESVAIYLGIVRAGCVAVSIADSFAPDEIATRLRIADAKAIFTQDVCARAGKRLPLYEKVVAAEAPRAIVLPAGETLEVELREGDLAWNDFLIANESFVSIPRLPDDASNILFSSGTTGDPKAIPWTHTSPIKCVVDGWLHHDIRPGDVVAWPTNLGWMMGPWLIYAALVNGASIALFEDAPNTRRFCKFVQDAKVTMLGVVPSLVKAWRTVDAPATLDWSSIRCFSSTGECSNAEDMHWLMGRAGYKPVIEYCGGTEIGGGYVTGTMVQPAVPATFTTPAMGLDMLILDHKGRPVDEGEVYLVPPSIGFSNTLLNRDHDEVYFKDTPPGPKREILRRHGDQMCRLRGGYFQAQGRADDTMNLGGIKTSSAEIERVVNELKGIRETAAVSAPPPGGGPERLFIFTVAEAASKVTTESLLPLMQEAIKTRLNPLFRVHEVRLIESLPRTASNKVMRRTLRGLCLPGS